METMLQITKRQSVDPLLPLLTKQPFVEAIMAEKDTTSNLRKLQGKTEQRFWKKVDKSGDCWEWTACKNESGYGRFWFNGKKQYAHRVSWQLENGSISDVMFCCHICDNPGCVNPGHLFIGTNADNMADKVAKGRQSRGYQHGKNIRGEKHGSARLAEADVISIRADSRPLKKIASDFGVSRALICLIKNRKRWAHVNRQDAEVN
jgi:hypothetical protein